MPVFNQLEMFAGDADEKQNPKDFLKAFNNLMFGAGVTLDATKIEMFANNLKSDSPADKWYNALAGEESTSFTSMVTSFRTRFVTEETKKTNMELEEEIQALRIAVDDLGKDTKVGGVLMPTHTAFANKIYQLAQDANIHSGTSSILNVRKALPDPLRDQLPHTFANWDAFKTAIKAVDTAKLREAVEKHKKEQELIRHVESLSQQSKSRSSSASVDTLTTKMGSFSISNKPKYERQPPASSTRSSSFSPRSAQIKATPEMLPTLKETLKKIRILEDTQANRVEVAKWRDAWHRSHGNAEPTVETGYPLSVGTSIPNGSECFNCGKANHQRMDCTSTYRIPAVEFRFRRLCSQVLRYDRDRPGINQVDTVSDSAETSWFDIMHQFEGDDQGKEQGSSD